MSVENEKIMSINKFYDQFRPPYYYVLAGKGLAPPQIPERFTPLHLDDQLTCEPHGEQLSLVDDPFRLLKNKMHDAIPLPNAMEQKPEGPTLAQIEARLRSYPTRAPEIKEKLKELMVDYFAQVSSALERAVFGTSAPLEIECERQLRDLCTFVDYLKHKQATFLLRKELQYQIDQKRQMAAMLRQMRQNCLNGDELLSQCTFPLRNPSK